MIEQVSDHLARHFGHKPVKGGISSKPVSYERLRVKPKFCQFTESAHILRELLRELDTHAWRGLGAWFVYGAPRVAGARSLLATWLAWNAPPPCVTCSTRQRFAALRTRQIAALAYGTSDDHTEAIDALGRVLLRRRGAVSLMVLDALAERRTW